VVREESRPLRGESRGKKLEKFSQDKQREYDVIPHDGKKAHWVVLVED